MTCLVRDRVTRVIHTSYAVGSKPGVHLDERPDSPPAGRYRRRIGRLGLKSGQNELHRVIRVK
jgi:hypothetical protein